MKMIDITTEDGLAAYQQVLFKPCLTVVYMTSCRLFTCIALAKAGLVVGPLHLSVGSSVRPSVLTNW